MNRLVIFPIMAFACCAAGFARAEWPEKPIRVIVPYTPGVGGDVMMRLISDDLGKRLGQPLVVENRGGAAGNIGTMAAAKSPPDGYTFLVGATPNYVVNHLLYGSFNIDPVKAFAPVTVMGHSPSVLFTSLNVPANDFKGFLAYAQSQKGKVSYGTPGIGTPVYFALEALNRAQKLEMTGVSYRGAAEVLLGVVAGDLSIGFALEGPAQQFIKAGKVRPLAVLANSRMASLPDTPTFRELGLPVFETWWAMSAPVGTPEPILNKMSEAMRSALSTPEVRKGMEAAGIVGIANTRTEAITMFASESANWGRTIKDLGVPRID